MALQHVHEETEAADASEQPTQRGQRRWNERKFEGDSLTA